MSKYSGAFSEAQQKNELVLADYVGTFLTDLLIRTSTTVGDDQTS